MPSWIDKIILKILGTEPVIKIMYSIVFFFMGMIFIPQDIYDLIALKTGNDWAWIVIFYATAFVVTDALQRTINAFWSTIKGVIGLIFLEYINQKSDESTADTILRLSSLERTAIYVFLENRTQTAYFHPSDIAIVKLKRKGLVEKKENQEYSNDNAESEYFIPDDKWEVILLLKHRNLI